MCVYPHFAQRKTCERLNVSMHGHTVGCSLLPIISDVRDPIRTQFGESEISLQRQRVQAVGSSLLAKQLYRVNFILGQFDIQTAVLSVQIFCGFHKILCCEFSDVIGSSGLKQSLLFRLFVSVSSVFG